MIKWNQKEILFKGIRKYIQKYNIKSVLDIGAGDGNLAERISKMVSEYVAVESDNKKVKKLKKIGINVIPGKFPKVKIRKKYELVLSSHSIPEDVKNIEKFITEAWKLVKKKGLLLIITFKGGKGDIFKLKKKLYGTAEILDIKHFEKIINTLSKFENPQIKKKISAIKSDNLKELMKIILFSLGKRKNRQFVKRVNDVLQKNFKTNNKNWFLFRYEHLFILLKK